MDFLAQPYYSINDILRTIVYLTKTLQVVASFSEYTGIWEIQCAEQNFFSDRVQIFPHIRTQLGSPHCPPSLQLNAYYCTKDGISLEIGRILNM